MHKKIFSKWPIYTNNEIQEVNNILKKKDVNYLFGKKGKEFEKKFSNYLGNKYSVALSNGSVALELAIRSLNLELKSEIIVTSRSFVASASSILNCGMNVKFCDINLNTQNIDIKSLEKNITKKTKAIIIVHFAGMPCEMDSLLKITKNKKIHLIEDCSQAHGAIYKGKKVGTFGIISTWSFCRDKIISTAGEGGMISTNSKKIRDKIWSLKDHGKNYNKYYKNQKAKSFQFKYIHDSLGSNYRLTEIQSAIGIKQLKMLDSFLKKRNANANIYKSIFNKSQNIIYTKYTKDIFHAYYKFYFYFIPKNNKSFSCRRKILKNLNKKGIPITTGGCAEIYKEKCFKPIKKLPNASILSNFSYCLAVDQTLNSNEIKIIGNEVFNELKKYS